MILIADSGSTKTEWGLVDKGTLLRTVLTPGINPYFQTEEEIAEIITDNLSPVIGKEPIERVYFYGAGCATPDKEEMIQAAVRSSLGVPAEVHSDLLGTARALCGTRCGIACILGTGSNSCLYDGERIVEHIPPLGFILGDEGSGAALGKALIRDCLKRQLPAPLIAKFMERYGLTLSSLLERVYKQPFPNRFLASLSPFLAENIAEEPIYRLVYDNFKEFFRLNVTRYTGYDTCPVHFVGSIAFHYQEALTDVARSFGIRISSIEKSLMSGLMRYHS